MDREDSPSELLADLWMHRVGVAAGLVAAVTLVGLAVALGATPAVVAVAIYAVALMAMLCCSAFYHLTPPSPRKALARRFDHAAIFLLIAGTYTPFTLGRLGGAWGYGLVAVVWAVALAGMAIKLFMPGRFERLSIVVYLALGWIGVVAFRPMQDVLGPAPLILIGVGGVLYSVGVIFHVWRSLKFQNAIWHGFVLAGAGCHYAAVLSGVVLVGAAN